MAQLWDVKLPGGTPSSSAVRVAGPKEVIFDWSRDACEPGDFPDLPARAFRDHRGRVQLIISHDVNRRLVGPDLDHLDYGCEPVMSSDRDPDPAAFNDREWLASVYSPDGRKVYALVHDEYQGHLHPGRCPSGEYRRCWYNAISFARSTDGGASYAQPPPPRHLVASVPYRYVADGGPLGTFSPSNVVRDPDDGYYYALLHMIGPGEEVRGVCVMRTRDLADPRSWRAWDGDSFELRFIDPYRAAGADSDEHLCRPVSNREIAGMRDSVTYNAELGQFLLVGTSRGYDDRRKEWVPGIYYSLSNDLLHWSERSLVIEAPLVETYACGDPDPIAYASILDPNSPSRNFETSDGRVYLYFTRFNYAGCERTDDRDLVRVPLKISR